MTLSETVRLYPTKEQSALLKATMGTYVATVNRLVSLAASGVSIAKYSSKDVEADLPAIIRGQCARVARSVVQKYQKTCRQAEYKKEKLPSKKQPPPLPKDKVAYLIPNK